MQLRVKLIGDKTLKAELDMFEGHLWEAIQIGLRAGMEVAVQEAQRRAPHRTGKLRRAIYARPLHGGIRAGGGSGFRLFIDRGKAPYGNALNSGSDGWLIAAHGRKMHPRTKASVPGKLRFVVNGQTRFASVVKHPPVAALEFLERGMIAAKPKVWKILLEEVRASVEHGPRGFTNKGRFWVWPGAIRGLE